MRVMSWRVLSRNAVQMGCSAVLPQMSSARWQSSEQWLHNYMRAQRSGTIANLGSICGWRGSASVGIYCAAKGAIALYSEALKGELSPFGIDVTCIEPGYFRTNFLVSGNRTVAKNRIPELSSITGEAKDRLDAYNKKQAGDPVKGATVIVQALTK